MYAIFAVVWLAVMAGMLFVAYRYLTRTRHHG